MYSNVLCDDHLFSSFIVSCIPELNLNEIREEAYSIQKNFVSREVSNINGYQSPIFDEKTNFKNFDLLKEIVEHFAKNYTDERNLNLPFPSSQWWMNINKTHDYNVLHTHGRADLIAVYYISMPENAGNLELLRNDGTVYSSFYRNASYRNIFFNIPAEEGRLYLMPGQLWHYVKSNKSEEDRISVSFNLRF